MTSREAWFMYKPAVWLIGGFLVFAGLLIAIFVISESAMNVYLEGRPVTYTVRTTVDGKEYNWVGAYGLEHHSSGLVSFYHAGERIWVRPDMIYTGKYRQVETEGAY